MSECLVVASNSGRADRKALSLPPGVSYRMKSESKIFFSCVVKRAPTIARIKNVRCVDL